MENGAKATDNQMIEEAVYRMKSIGVPRQFIDAFAAHNEIRTFFSPGGGSNVCDEWEDQILGDYEKPNHGYPWGIIKDESELYDVNPRITYHILYVSPDTEKWERERAELSAMEPTVFSIIYEIHRYPDDVIEEFTKRKIRRTEDGSIVLA